MATPSHVHPSRVSEKVDTPKPRSKGARIACPDEIKIRRGACHEFLLPILDTLLFLHSPTLIDGAVVQVVLQAVGGHSYVEALLAETIRSLDYAREVQRGRMRGSPHLLLIWLTAYIRPFCSLHPFSYIIDRHSLIRRLIPAFRLPERSFSQWRHFLEGLTLAQFLWAARWNPGGPMITGCPGVVGVPLLSHLGSMLVFPGRVVREIRRVWDTHVLQDRYFLEHPSDEEWALSATSAYVAQFYAPDSTPAHRAKTILILRAPPTVASEAESSAKGTIRVELLSIREERDRLRCELVHAHVELVDYRSLQRD
ncbi:hypothetical protein CRG98_001140 [Punica granatum]|uniref:DUF7745 domain-containing protein n=1 Tax=Punica granatum TaxID=22663 RepID=A0A2I0LCU8_PUNGR|nr:hypothetical protein CRG98_001140 [Punica granatum]